MLYITKVSQNKIEICLYKNLRNVININPEINKITFYFFNSNKLGKDFFKNIKIL